jgi:hypothetical protein
MNPSWGRPKTVNARLLVVPVASNPLRSGDAPCCIPHATSPSKICASFSEQKILPIKNSSRSLPLEALTVPFLPHTPGLHVQRLRAYLPRPLSQPLGNELQPVSPNEYARVSRAPTSHPPRFRSPTNSPNASPLSVPNTPACTRRSPLGCAALVRRSSSPSRSRSSTRDSSAPAATAHTNHPQATTASRPLFLRHLQPCASPYPLLHSILAHRPSRMLQQCGDACVGDRPGRTRTPEFRNCLERA